MVGLRFILGDEETSKEVTFLDISHFPPLVIWASVVHCFQMLSKRVLIIDKGIMPTRELGHGTSIFDSRGVTHVGVSGNRFISTRNVEHWIARFQVFLEVILGWDNGSIPRGEFIGCLDDIFRLIAKIGVQGLPVNIRRGLFVFVGGKNT